jgi:double-stranded uracil-DNA glycosylase
MKGVNLYLSIEQRKPRGRCAVVSLVDRGHADTRRAAPPDQERPLANYEPDILAEGLEVVFCGINPATTAAAAGHNFSNGSNRFWTALHLSGFTDRRLQPHEEQQLLTYRCGLTAVVNRPTRRAEEITAEEFAAARPAFEVKMRCYAPRSIAFLGKRAVSAMLGQPDLPWGRLPARFAGTMVWILPNPSGLNRRFTLEALVTAYAELRGALYATGSEGEPPAL